METTAGKTEAKSMDISIIVPFDIGESYVFKVPNNLCERCIWKNIFRDANQCLTTESEWEWNTDQLGEEPTFYREPFGLIARYKRKKPITDALGKLIEEGRCFTDFKSLEIIFFPRGIGILELRGTMKSNISPQTWRDDFKHDRRKLKEALHSNMSEARKAYVDVMDSAARKREDKFVSSIKLPARRGEIDEVRFPYAIGFTEAAKLSADPATEPKPTTVSNPNPLGYCYVSPKLEPSLTLWIDVGWGETTVYKSGNSEAAQGAVVDTFIVAMACWFSLILMSSLVSQFLRDLFVDIANDRRRLTDKEGQRIRLAFMDASNASRPVRWTFRERDILLLDRIHATWSTKRWWRSIEERTTLLAARHNEVATDIRRNSEDKLATLVIILGIMAALSAIKDVGDMIGADGSWTITFMIVAIIGAVGLFFWARAGEKS